MGDAESQTIEEELEEVVRDIKAFETRVGMQLTTQPPRTQAQLQTLPAANPTLYDAIVKQVDYVTGGRLTNAGRSAGSVGDPDGDMAREDIARALVRHWAVEYADLNGQPWQGLLQDVPAVRLTLFDAQWKATSFSHTVSGMYWADFVSAVGKVKGHPSPDTKRRERLATQQAYVVLQMGLAVGLDAWHKQYGAAQRSCTALAMDVAARVVSGLVLQVKGLICADRPTSARIPGHASHPLLDIPPYSAYPGGHAATVAALCKLLDAIGVDKTRKGVAATMAADITENRNYARLHTEADTTDGRLLGERIGDALLSPEARSIGDWGALLAEAEKEWA